ncbi:hypothetical protein SAZ_25295 [Streptomyces noursei ZPM]|uniref:Uncharacterized protein n=1 Tax=Streptomyces noursei TaxID=1971 RepID=A0A401R5K5_STRNR|nr:hypothetical protein [Streptomyces noursei]AKA08828.1 hypothetical protein SAZ_25295 [Streptomyces noursei ZPM]EOT04326.1 hypothetical protein K530_09223 [Streptomyces noursei CCRC 11814]EXU86875.1 hypothetical protein P354_39975 [Streptomyces noursei PD-1]UWS73795.1 hypothetical protein N1H47_22620 [Streptomyces noursei]GCB92880.1 hypothetical protein SALB_05655 [Streptomyces noursei]
MKRRDAVRIHSEEAAAFGEAAETADEPTRSWLLDAANDHQALADAARHGEYEYGYGELED